MRSKEYVGALTIIASFLLLKIGSLIALYKVNTHADKKIPHYIQQKTNFDTRK